MDYYHASKQPLQIGTSLEARLITPAAWVMKVIEAALDDPVGLAPLKSLLLTDAYVRAEKPAALPFYLREVIFERMRQKDFADRPSRLTSVFLSASREDATRFVELTKPTLRPHLYLCSLPDGATTFVADLHYIKTPNHLAPIVEELNKIKENAILYWQGHQCDSPVLETVAPTGLATITAEVEGW